MDMGHEGKKALEKMFEMAQERKIVDSDIQIQVM
jgi:predicted solute-binding protein